MTTSSPAAMTPAALADALEPCPFCGDAGHLESVTGTKVGALYRGACVECDCTMKTWHDEESEAIAAWNRRASPAVAAEVAEVVKRLRAFLSSDHERGCQGRCYACTCGWDAQRDILIDQAATLLLSTQDARDAGAEEWQDIATAPKGRKIIAGYFNKLGNWRSVMARYYEAGTLESYNDATEDGFAAEGWYEESETHEELLPCDEPPTHWRPLPTPPVKP